MSKSLIESKFPRLDYYGLTNGLLSLNQHTSGFQEVWILDSSDPQPFNVRGIWKEDGIWEADAVWYR